MSNARARANQKLYHAKILIEAWGLALSEEQTPSSVLEKAFGEAVSNHLALAYGWFLLEVFQPTAMPTQVPRACCDLPPVEEGLKTPPEILEFTQLERQPWLARLVQCARRTQNMDSNPSTGPAPALSITLGQVAQNFNPQEAQFTLDQLNTLFDRMTDSLDEY